MNKDDHLLGLKYHYIEEIHEAVFQSEREQGNIIDYQLLNDKIHNSWKAAELEGVTHELFKDWITDAIPEHIAHLNIIKSNKAA